MDNPTETEVKIRLVTDASQFADHLQSLGYTVSAPKIFESNTLYDTADGSLRSQGLLLRLRKVGERGIITWKGKSITGPYKSRPEIETTVGSVETLAHILNQLGLQADFRYEKYRTEFQKTGSAGVITVDQTPIGWFIELEGPGPWIDSTAAQLGFSSADYILESYGKLYLSDCISRGVEPSHMVFPSNTLPAPL